MTRETLSKNCSTDESRSATSRWTRFLNDERGQTVEDYAIGMGYFLITAMFVFGFLGSLGMPYESFSGDSQDIRGDRVAVTLIQDTFSKGEEGTQGTTLDKGCVTSFFTNQPSECGYTPGNLSESFAILDGDQLYIEIAEPDSPASTSVDSASTVDGVTLKRGDDSFHQMRASVTERIVYLDGEAYMLRVVVK